MEAIHKTFQLETATENKDFENVFVASNSTIDADGDSMDVSKIDLDRFNKNPIVLAEHTPTLNNIVARGKAYVEDNQLLLGITKWNTTQNASEIKEMVQEGFINTVSIGFQPKEEGKYKDGVYHWGAVELLEVSLVAIPSNKDAVKIKTKKDTDTPKPLSDIEKRKLRLQQQKHDFKTITRSN